MPPDGVDKTRNCRLQWPFPGEKLGAVGVQSVFEPACGWKQYGTSIGFISLGGEAASPLWNALARSAVLTLCPRRRQERRGEAGGRGASLSTSKRLCSVNHARSKYGSVKFYKRKIAVSASSRAPDNRRVFMCRSSFLHNAAISPRTS